VAENTATEIVAQTEEAVRQVVENPWLERLARLGYAVRGLLYAAIGLLSVEVAMGVRHAPEDAEGVIALIGRQSYGPVLLIVIAIGLAALALWGFARIIYDPLDGERNVPRNMLRVGYFVSGLTYSILVFTTLRVLLGLRLVDLQGQPVPEPERAAAGLLSTPWGPWLIGLVGLVALIYGAVELFRAVRSDFERQLKRYALSPHQTRWACRLGRCGTAARGLVIALVGLFLVRAALSISPENIRGIDGALLALARQPYGPWLLAVVALGLMAFGAYSLLSALWFRLRQAGAESAPLGRGPSSS
jgi:hypothetical protein